MGKNETLNMLIISLLKPVLFVCLFACLFVCLYVCMFVCLYVCMFVCLFVGMFVCLFFEGRGEGKTELKYERRISMVYIFNINIQRFHFT